MAEQLPPAPPPFPGGYYPCTPPPAQKKFQWRFPSIIGLLTVLVFTYGMITAAIHTAAPPTYGMITAAIHTAAPPTDQPQPPVGPIAYPPAYEESYLQGCETYGGTTDGCTCAMHWIESHMTLDQYIAESNASVQAGVLTPDLHEADVVCAGESSAQPCSILSNEGNCYSTGEYCRRADLNSTTTDADGRVMTCIMESGRPHWR